MKAIIGIGNPEKKYFNTRHNIGFMTVDFIAKKFGAEKFKFEKKFNSEISKCKINGNSFILAKPQTYVNKIGEAVAKIKSFYKLKNEDIIIIQDDLDIAFGKTKTSFNKNSGGHRGIESVFKNLKSKNVYRLRMGIANTALKKARSQKNKKEAVAKFVLSKFTPSEQKGLKKALESAIEGAINCHRN